MPGKVVGPVCPISKRTRNNMKNRAISDGARDPHHAKKTLKQQKLDQFRKKTEAKDKENAKPTLLGAKDKGNAKPVVIHVCCDSDDPHHNPLTCSASGHNHSHSNKGSVTPHAGPHHSNPAHGSKAQPLAMEIVHYSPQNAAPASFQVVEKGKKEKRVQTKADGTRVVVKANVKDQKKTNRATKEHVESKNVTKEVRKKTAKDGSYTVSKSTTMTRVTYTS